MPLNKFDEPRVEVIESKDDIQRLQAEGLVPQELRYQWRWLPTVRYEDDFVLAYYGALNANLGSFVSMDGSLLTWEDSLMKGEYRKHSLPPGIVARYPGPASPVDFRRLKRDARPLQRAQQPVLVFQGGHVLELGRDDGPPIRVTIDVAPKGTPHPF